MEPNPNRDSTETDYDYAMRRAMEYADRASSYFEKNLQYMGSTVVANALAAYSSMVGSWANIACAAKEENHATKSLHDM